MPLTYIFSQIFAALWFTFLILTYFTKSITKIRIYTFINALCLIISFLLLNAITGVWAILIIFIVSLVMCIPNFGKTEKFTIIHIVLIVISWMAMLIITYYTYQGWHSILPCIATLIGTYSLIQKNPLIYKILQIPQGLLYLLYSIVIFSPVMAIEELALIIILFFGIYKDIKREKQ